MRYLGSERIVTYSFADHITAEDYGGNHQSDVSIAGKAKVVKIVNRFKSHEDSINYNEFLNNQNNWRDGDSYNCISITGKSVKMRTDELGGNQIWLETYENSNLLTFRLCHLDSVSVNVGDIVDSNTILGYQGNTGLVLSSKNVSDPTYGSHVHLEVTNRDGNYLNPRKYASGEIVTDYINGSNKKDENKNQIKILVDKINIRQEPSELSLDIGDVYIDEIYDVLDTIDSDIYIWYKITTNTNITGYVASKKDSNWIEYIPKKEDKKTDNKEPTDKDEQKKDDNKENNNSKNDDYKLIFTCLKDDYYYLKLYEGEQLYIKKAS